MTKLRESLIRTKKSFPKLPGNVQIFIPIPEILGNSGNGNENPKQGWAPGRVFPVELLTVLSYFFVFLRWAFLSLNNYNIIRNLTGESKIRFRYREPGLGPRSLYLVNKRVLGEQLGEQLVLGVHSRCSSTFQKCSPRSFFQPWIWSPRSPLFSELVRCLQGTLEN